ncbi:TRAP transporter large permease [Mesorhizobium australicum]|uniref:TRAP transporter large permease protein n=1 Tax=Mesorhizobium australicum TaxID=536018 RepID=A0A1X7PXU7_9HYPH|nr:TRAP transporter large permease [Mesorhizobium australicum]SMH56460.1 C4-dicarboxylate transporter, DctM subunit [Mesorhizobium australicum]
MLLLLVLFFVLLYLGTPLFVVLGASVSVLIVAEGHMSLTLVAQKMIDELNNDLLMSLPFFGMAAVFMQRGGVAKSLVDLAIGLIGWMRGGLGLVAVAACTMFATISGSSVTTALAMGVLLLPSMLAKGYGRPFSTGLLGAGGTLGILIPPSLPLILYAILAEESVPRLFLAAVIPGLMQALLLAIYVIVMARVRNLPAEPRQSAGEIGVLALRAAPALLVPIVIAVGIYGGLLTITDSAVAAAFVSLILSIFVYRGVKLRETISVIGESIYSVSAIILIIMTAMVFGHWVTESGVPARLVEWTSSLNLQPWQFIVIVMLILIVLGTILEIASILLITTPILIPLLGAYDISPIHFGILMAINMEIAAITPPVGLNLYVLAAISKGTTSEVNAGIWPFVVLMLGLLLLVAFIPGLTLWLPEMVYGP